MSELPTYSQDASRDFFLDSRSYTDFDTTRPDFRRIIACAEPRNEDRGPKKIKTAIQTAGAGAGDAEDRAIAQTIIRNHLVTLDQAFKEEAALRGTSVLGGHPRCKFVLANGVVLREEIDPSDFTMDDLDRTLRDYGIEEQIRPLMPHIFDAAKVQLDYVEEAGSLDNIIGLIDEHYPDHSNVAAVHGENVAQIYVENHHPHAGLNRDKKAKQRNKGIDIQGYHESRRAAYEDILNSYDLSRVERGYRIAAFLLRSAASRKVLGSLQPNTEFWKITQGEKGLLIAQQEGLN
jgi:hypothetical protein